jgi:hypothetical protein
MAGSLRHATQLGKKFRIEALDAWDEPRGGTPYANAV